MSTTVHVEGIASQTTEKEVRDFFSFCGKISNLSVTPTTGASDSTKSATVTFEKETAAKTALLLDNTQLGPAQVQVKSTASLSELAGSSPEETSKSDEVHQEDKPRARIVAEYLAHGYVISDKIIERALALDKQHGVSTRFTSALTNFDSKYHATDKAKAADDKYAVTKSATNAWNSLSSYFDSALSTPTGQKLRKFYEEGNKQVIDVHNEARHLANLKSGKSATSPQGESSTTAAPVPETGEKTAEVSASAPAAASSTSEKPPLS